MNAYQKSDRKLQDPAQTTVHPQKKGGRRKILGDLVQSASSFKLSEKMYLDVATQIWIGIDTPRSLACYLLLKYGEYAQLVNLKCSPSSYLQERGDQFRDDYQATQLLAKWPNFAHPDLDPELACKTADAQAEEACLRSNRRLLRTFAAPTSENSAYLHLITQMQADIARVLGPFDPVRWEKACRFGPGKASKQEGLIDYEKLVNQPSCTPEFLPFGVRLISGCDPWLSALSGRERDLLNELATYSSEEEAHRFDVTLVPGDSNTMVPKNAKTRRGIRPQPGLNVWAQLGLGQMIREQLKIAGLDLDDQTPNQGLARLGSLPTYDFVTVDLKGASGHICRVLVDKLGEDTPRWKHAMDLCRTRLQLPHGAVDDGDAAWVPLHSYSAMGNGFTFELETLIFWAAVRACRRAVQDTQQYRVYGDDIICSRETADLLIPFLDFLGFPTNVSKTFIEGPFRESCGADYWLGTNIRPITFSITSEEIQEGNRNGTAILRWVQTSNAIRRVARLRNHDFGCDRKLFVAWRTAILKLPQSVRNSLKSPWTVDRDDSLITDEADALTNPLIKRCGSLQCLISPRLSVTVGQLQPSSFLGMRAALLYRVGGDRLAVRFDRTRSWLRRVLQPQPSPEQLEAKLLDKLGVKLSSKSYGQLPNIHALGLGAGWEVFQPVGDHTEWC